MAYSDDDVRTWLTQMSEEAALDLTADSQALATQALLIMNGSIPPPGPMPVPPTRPRPPTAITPAVLLDYMIDPTLAWLEELIGIPMSDEARVLLLTIIGQETNWGARLQQGGPARGWYQFESGGGIAGVLTHPASSANIRIVCDALLIPCTQSTCYEAVAWNGILATSFARLLLYTDPAPLPAVGEIETAYAIYDRCWRPGSKRPQDWPGNYATAAQELL